MPQVQENGMVSRLHYALTDSQCNKCGAQLEWKAEFNDINSPKYTTKHCGQDFIITVDTVKVELVKQTTEQGREENLEVRRPTENESRKEHQEQPNAITMAELLKDKALLQKKTKLGDGSNIKAEDR
jgi:hypothetical protein